mgnify:CR=1 FL=1
MFESAMSAEAAVKKAVVLLREHMLYIGSLPGRGARVIRRY